MAGIRARRSHGLGWAGGVLWFGPAGLAWSAFYLSFLNIFVCVYVFITLSLKKIDVVYIQLAFFFCSFVNFLCEIRTFFYRSSLWGFNGAHTTRASPLPPKQSAPHSTWMQPAPPCRARPMRRPRPYPRPYQSSLVPLQPSPASCRSSQASPAHAGPPQSNPCIHTVGNR